ncbi:hypothetical protein I4131_12290 [Staphylococcus aureus]|nr:hypothetical protein [Staphylococcus aureus]
MNQNELGAKYQTYLLREFFQDKPEFSVPPLNNKELEDKQSILEQLNPNVKDVVEENVKATIEPFNSLDNSIKAINNMSEVLQNEKDINVLNSTYEPLETKIHEEYDKTKEDFNDINSKYQIANIENQTDFMAPERQCYITSISDGSIYLETDEAQFTVSIPHQDYLDMQENPNKYEFTFDRNTGYIYYHESEENESVIGYESQGLEDTPQYRKNKVIEDENDNEMER